MIEGEEQLEMEYGNNKPIYRCEQCGEVLDGLDVLVFAYDGTDHWERVPIEVDRWGIRIEVTPDWCGHGFDDYEEEQCLSIRCPHCHIFPFKAQEISSFSMDIVHMFPEQERMDEDE